MTTLKESIEQRRAESRSVRSYELANEPVLSLQIHSWDGEKTVLPWANFNSAGHRSTSAGEQLTLRFTGRFRALTSTAIPTGEIR
jgi:hypothetical protein